MRISLFFAFLFLFVSCEDTNDISPVDYSMKLENEMGLKYIGSDLSTLGTELPDELKRNGTYDVFYNEFKENFIVVKATDNGSTVEAYEVENLVATRAITLKFNDTNLEVLDKQGMLAEFNIVGGKLEYTHSSKGLGPRQDGESFGGCFSRNWNSFCDGFVSCATQITHPYSVASAIAAVCAFS